MSGPRLEINIDKIEANAKLLIQYLGAKGISITGITKSTLGSFEISNALIRGGIKNLGDSRIENIEYMHHKNVNATMTLIRSPLFSQIKQVVLQTKMSFNTEIKILEELSRVSILNNLIHEVVLMVELGDLREGILPIDMNDMVSQILKLPGIKLKGIGTNLACRSGVSPSFLNMEMLSDLANSIEQKFTLKLDIISGGNSANLNWALKSEIPNRVNNLRLGESLLLGCETLNRQPIKNLHTDAFTLITEVIESKVKPSIPTGVIAQNAFGHFKISCDQGSISQTILGIGRQDIDPDGLTAPLGITIIDATSDHLIIQSDSLLSIGSEVSFQVNYSALNRAMTSPFVEKRIIGFGV